MNIENILELCKEYVKNLNQVAFFQHFYIFRLLNRYLSIIIKENAITNVHGFNSLALIKVLQ